MPPNIFDQNLPFGQEGERIVAQWLLDRGAALLPLYQFVGHDRAPVLLWKLDGEEAGRVAPDFVAWAKGENYFVEVKRKRQWVEGDRYAGIGRGLETGMNRRHFDDYCSIADKTSREVLVFFLHEKRPPVGLFFAKLSTLRSVARHWGGRYPNGGPYVTQPETFFPLSALRRIEGFAVPEAA